MLLNPLKIKQGQPWSYLRNLQRFSSSTSTFLSDIFFFYLALRHLRTFLSKSKDLIAPLSDLCYCTFVKLPYSKLYGKLQFQEPWGWSWRRGQGRSQPHPVLGKRMIYNVPQNWQVTRWVKHFLYHLQLLQTGLCPSPEIMNKSEQFDAYLKWLGRRPGNGKQDDKHPSLCDDMALLSCSRSGLKEQLNILANNYCQKGLFMPKPQ